MGKSLAFFIALVLVVGLEPKAAISAPNETPLMVNPAISSRSGAPASGIVSRGGGETFIIRVRNSCFGTNLRSVTNPLSPSSIIHADLTLAVGTDEIPIKVKYPAQLVTAAGMVPSSDASAMRPETFTLPIGSKASIYGNTVELKIPNSYKVTVDLEGNMTETGNLATSGVALKNYSFVQEVTDCSGPGMYGAYGHSATQPAYPCGQYMGTNGPLTANISGLSISNNNTVVELNVSFPGQTGFCGGYYSPLMLFFSNKRPSFDQTVSFPIGPSKKIHWPSGGGDYAILAIDRNGDGKISEKNELFGDQEALINGFEMLKLFDENNDGFISAADKEAYAKLLLWQDDGDGVSEAGELMPLSSKVEKIKLSYVRKVKSLGAHAEEREQADFWTKDGKKRKIIDVWFAPGKS